MVAPDLKTNMPTNKVDKDAKKFPAHLQQTVQALHLNDRGETYTRMPTGASLTCCYWLESNIAANGYIASATISHWVKTLPDSTQFSSSWLASEHFRRA